jgi:hypothetical protein
VTRDAQVRVLLAEMAKHGRVGVAAARAGMDRKTARNWLRTGRMPSEVVVERTWRTRDDPFEADWPAIEAQLKQAPGLEAKTIFEALLTKTPDRYEPGQLRTLQRRIKAWRATSGPEKRVFFGQEHRPGEAAQTDFTRAAELGVTVAGEVFAHLLCVFVLPYSNWFWATVCLSESMAALRRGVQEAVFRLGRVPRFHQTDNSTAATHRIPGGRGCESGESETEGSRKRPFNDEYRALMSHLGMQPRTTVVGAKEQNGDVESHNGVLKRLLEQALLLRGDRDFESRDAWEAFVFEVVLKHNRHCGSRLADELAVMEPLRAKRLPDFERLPHIRVSDWSTVRVKHCAYSVPSRLIGEWVEVRLFEERVEVRFGGVIQLACERLRGRNLHRIDYRHVIWSLVRKPGAFQRYVYREEMFPSVVFRRTYDALTAAGHGVQADLEYLRVLHLAASTLEVEVSGALESLLARGERPTAEAVRELLRHAQPPPVPAIEVGEVDLKHYDRLLVEVTR